MNDLNRHTKETICGKCQQVFYLQCNSNGEAVAEECPACAGKNAFKKPFGVETGTSLEKPGGVVIHTFCSLR